MPEKIRVLQVFGSLHVGGAETRMMEVFRGIDRSQYAFDFLTMDLSAQHYEQEIRELGGRVFKIAPPRKNPFENLKNIYNVLKSNGPYHAIHAHTSFHCGLAMLAAKCAGVPVRISHARTTGSKHGNGFVQRWMLRGGRFLIAAFATHRLAISKDAARYLFGKKACTKKNVTVLPNAIDTDLYFQQPFPSCQKLYEEAGFSEDHFIIGHVGRFEQMKNHIFLLNLFREVYQQNDQARLVLIGDGSLRESIVQKTEEYGLTDKVFFAGVRGDVHMWLHIFNVVVIPSFYEGLCGVAIEAQAAGTPCVLSTGIPKEETDLHLGLTTYLSLEAPASQWIQQIAKAAEQVPPTHEEIQKAFEETGYSVCHVQQILCRIYSA